MHRPACQASDAEAKTTPPYRQRPRQPRQRRRQSTPVTRAGAIGGALSLRTRYMADKPSTAAKSLFSSACIAGLVQRYGETQRLDDFILSLAKMCENSCAYLDFALRFNS